MQNDILGKDTRQAGSHGPYKTLQTLIFMK